MNNSLKVWGCCINNKYYNILLLIFIFLNNIKQHIVYKSFSATATSFFVCEIIKIWICKASYINWFKANKRLLCAIRYGYLNKTSYNCVQNII